MAIPAPTIMLCFPPEEDLPPVNVDEAPPTKRRSKSQSKSGKSQSKSNESTPFGKYLTPPKRHSRNPDYVSDPPSPEEDSDCVLANLPGIVSVPITSLITEHGVYPVWCLPPQPTTTSTCCNNRPHTLPPTPPGSPWLLSRTPSITISESTIGVATVCEMSGEQPGAVWCLLPPQPISQLGHAGRMHLVDWEPPAPPSPPFTAPPTPPSSESTAAIGTTPPGMGTFKALVEAAVAAAKELSLETEPSLPQTPPVRGQAM
ncbi:uncharacterized protein EHS24_001898 [Apiotrichum porosum]|uniref:Uncharacterized protein n=1 Tax=Apiotrichum porosum TaxID=105984 RepID=A0A427XJP1_9TREE|nr:uncharacterized protein EHS24_001898 [Apiotrichum porosum]RSH78974.1 hypothetical protein EHS24_001898 [Apiotrichum porosum]